MNALINGYLTSMRLVANGETSYYNSNSAKWVHESDIPEETLFELKEWFRLSEEKAMSPFTKQKDLYVLKEYKRRHFNIAEVFKNGVKVATANMFYSVTQDWIFIYETIGGSGTSYSKGDVVMKIFIGESDFEKVICQS